MTGILTDQFRMIFDSTVILEPPTIAFCKKQSTRGSIRYPTFIVDVLPFYFVFYIPLSITNL